MLPQVWMLRFPSVKKFLLRLPGDTSCTTSLGPLTLGAEFFGSFYTHGRESKRRVPTIKQEPWTTFLSADEIQVHSSSFSRLGSCYRNIY
jgi:hypothetical protein